MIRQEFRLLFRNVWSQKLYYFVSWVSLTAAFSTILVIWNFIAYQKSFDKFHPGHENIYRIVSDYTDLDEEYPKATSPGATGLYLAENIDEIKDFATISTNYGPHELLISDDVFYQSYLFASDGVTDIFDFSLIQGSFESFGNPGTAIIPESVATKWFEDGEATNQLVDTQEWGEYTIVGVFKDFPKNSHFRPELILSIPTNWSVFETWNWPAYYNYVRTEDSFDISRLDAILERVSKDLYAPSIHIKHKTIEDVSLSAQKISTIHLNSNRMLEFEVNGNSTFVSTLFWISVLVWIVAILNYLNLYTAQVNKRFFEIGIRRINGSSTLHEFGSYLLSPLFSINLSGLTAILIYFLANSLDLLIFEDSSQPQISSIIIMLLPVLGLSLLPFLVAYPFLSRSLRSILSLISGSGRAIAPKRSHSLSRIFLVIQFVISSFLIGTSITMYKQFEYVSKLDLGMKPEKVLRVKLNSNYYSHAQNLSARLNNLSFVESTGTSSKAPGGEQEFRNQEIQFEGGQKVIKPIMKVSIDPGFVPTLGIDIISGRNLNHWIRDSTYLEALVNESFVKEFGIADPIGLTLRTDRFSYMGNLEARIVGVVKDFNFNSIYNKIPPMIYDNVGGNEVFVKVNPINLDQSLEAIEGLAFEITRSKDYEISFLDQHFEKFYKAEKDKKNLFLSISIISVVIAGLGLFAMSAKLIQSKAEENSIRKVFGSTTKQILIRSFYNSTKFALMGFVFSIPLIQYYNAIWLEQFAYRINIGPSIYAGCFILILLISLGTVLYNSKKSADVNPAEILRS